MFSENNLNIQSTNISKSFIKTYNFPRFTGDSASEVTDQYQTESLEETELELRFLNPWFSCYIHGGQPVW